MAVVLLSQFNCWILILEAQVHAWVSLYGICGGQSGIGTDISLSSLIFPCQ
jgi:hypothetical protein